jgi:TAP42-like family
MPFAEAGDGEELEREYWLTRIQHASVHSLQLLRTLEQEQELLAGMLKRTDEGVDDVQAQVEGACPQMHAIKFSRVSCCWRSQCWQC